MRYGAVMIICFFQIIFQAAPVFGKPFIYVAMGDSYTIGSGVTLQDTWPSQLAGRLDDAGFSVLQIVNLARAGWTSQQAIDYELPELKGVKADFVSLQIGVNDWIHEANGKTFAGRLRRLMDGIQDQLDHPENLLIVTIPDFSCSPRGKTWGYGKSAKNGLGRFNQILKREAHQRKLTVIDIYELSRELCLQPEMFASDDLHPSAKQYAAWVDMIFPVVTKILGKNH